DQKVVEVEFDKPVSGVTADHFYHSYSSWDAKSVWANADLDEEIDGAVTKVYVVFADGDESEVKDRALPSGDVEFTIRDENSDGDAIEDNWGNAFNEKTYDLKITADREPPTVTGVEVESGTEIEVTFSEAIGNLTDEDAYTFLDADGDELDLDNI
ncbi:hypothetical protein, partial [Chengkuizengella axinellae]